MRKTDLAWAAGVVDGEGCISGTIKGTITLQVAMCDAATLWRFKAILGGSMSKWFHRPRRVPFRRVSLSGKNALRAIRLLTPWLSPLKLADFAYAQTLAPNAGVGIGGTLRKRTHCPKGHPFFGKNVIWYTGPHGHQRVCRKCSRETNRRWYDAHKHTKFWRKYRTTG